MDFNAIRHMFESASVSDLPKPDHPQSQPPSLPHPADPGSTVTMATTASEHPLHLPPLPRKLSVSKHRAPDSDASEINIRPSQLKQNMLLNHFEQRDPNPDPRPVRHSLAPSPSQPSMRERPARPTAPQKPSPSELAQAAANSKSTLTSPNHPSSAENSDYSDVGDYTEDTEFYVPGVNENSDGPTQQPNLISRPSAPLRTPYGHSTKKSHHDAKAQPEMPGAQAGRRGMYRILSTPMPMRHSSSRHTSPIEEDDSFSKRPFEVGSSHDLKLDETADDDSMSNSTDQRHIIIDGDEADDGRDDNDEDDDEEEEEDDDDGDETDGDGPVVMVRQHSNFSRLSAQSWLTVDSAQEVPVSSELVDEPTSRGIEDTIPGPSSSASASGGYLGVGAVPRSSDAGTGSMTGTYKAASNTSDMGGSGLFLNRRFSGVTDHDPASLFGVDVQGDAIERIQAKAVQDMSVLECCVLLQAGVSALKRKSFRRCATRRVWLGPDCDRLHWKSKKNGMETDEVKLQRVAKLRSIDREVVIEIMEGYRISLMFNSREQAGLWVRALSCLIPLQARIYEKLGVTPPDKDREDYTLSDDVFDGTPLRDMMAVNSYVVLCCAKGHAQRSGYKLAFSRSDGQFCALRYIPRRISLMLLRSPEEIAVLKRLSHPNVVKYHECLADNERGGHYVVFEHVARGTLMDSYNNANSNGTNSNNTAGGGITASDDVRHSQNANYHQHSNANGATRKSSTSKARESRKTLSEADAREMMLDILSALEYLHTLRIAHGDIRPENLLRSVNGNVKVNAIGCITHDFTEVRNMGALMRARLNGASCAFIAPEQCWLVDNAPEAHAKSYAMDVWSVGVVLYYMLFGSFPFKGNDDAKVQHSICHDKLRIPRHPDTSAKVRSLLKGILDEKDPKTRIALNELRKHPWFFEETPGTAGPSGAVGALQGLGGHGYADGGAAVFGGRHDPPPRIIVTPDEVNSAVQTAKVRIGSRRR